MTEVFFDWETRSPVPIIYGTPNYATKAEPLILTWAADSDPVKLWDVIGGEPMPREIADLGRDPEATWIAHNCSFDRRINPLAGLRIPLTRYRDTRSQAYAHGLPGSLETLGKVLGLSEAEAKFAEDGKKLIQLFCVPKEVKPNGTAVYNDRHSHPEQWGRFCEYGIQDTAALRAIAKRLPAHNYRGENLRLWHLDQAINSRGFGFDSELALAARKVLDAAKGKSDAQVDLATGGAATAATQRAKLLAWFNSSGLPIANMKAAEIREWLEVDDIDPVHRFLLELRLEGAKSSGAKYRRGLELVSPDGRVRDSIQFGGAGRTGRFSGKGFQPHNMKRPVIDTTDDRGRRITVPVKWRPINEGVIPAIKDQSILRMPEFYGGVNTACTNAMRGAIIVRDPGNEFTVADWSNIESRVLAWIADETWKLAAYEAADRGEAVDLYKKLWHSFFGTPYEDMTDQHRQGGKVTELAFGFGGSVGAIVTMAAAYNMDLDELAPFVLQNAPEPLYAKARKAWRRALLKGEDYALEAKTFIACDILKQMYRRSNERINDLRHEVDKATKAAIKEPNALFQVAKCKIWSTGHFLIIELPSGRRLLYSAPRIEHETERDPDTGKTTVYESISYMTARGKQWRREKAWSGLFIENIVQAIANDVLRAGLLNVHDWTKTQPHIVQYLMTLPEDERTAIVLHVHDEITVDLPAGYLPLDKLISLITDELVRKTPWMRGLPLAADGWTGPRYHK